MNTHLCIHEDVLLVLQERGRNIRHGTVPGEGARRLGCAGFQKPLLGEGDPRQHVVIGGVLTISRCAGRNALRVLDVCSEVLRRLWGSQEVVRTHALEVELILLEGGLVVAQPHGPPCQRYDCALAPLLEGWNVAGFHDDLLLAPELVERGVPGPTRVEVVVVKVDSPRGVVAKEILQRLCKGQRRRHSHLPDAHEALIEVDRRGDETCLAFDRGSDSKMSRLYMALPLKAATAVRW